MEFVKSGDNTFEIVVDPIDVDRDYQYITHCWDKFFLPPFELWDCGTVDSILKTLAESLIIIAMIVVLVLILRWMCCT